MYMSETTPGWKLVSIGVEGDHVSISGVNALRSEWSPMPEPPIIVSHPQYPRERHEMFVYELQGPRGLVRFAAGEFSNGVWGFYIPAPGARGRDT